MGLQDVVDAHAFVDLLDNSVMSSKILLSVQYSSLAITLHTLVLLCQLSF